MRRYGSGWNRDSHEMLLVSESRLYRRYFTGVRCLTTSLSLLWRFDNRPPDWLLLRPVRYIHSIRDPSQSFRDFALVDLFPLIGFDYDLRVQRHIGIHDEERS